MSAVADSHLATRRAPAPPPAGALVAPGASGSGLADADEPTNRL